MLQRNLAHGEPSVAGTSGKRMPGDQQVSVVLKPISHPELDEIHIDENLFAIGRTEAPFASYAPDVIADLSRRHARIFSEYGAVYIADIESKNGTTVNGVSVEQKITRLRDGDEICFGRALSYRVQLSTRATQRKSARQLVSLTLTPVRDDLGLQPIVITQFPFLISKADQVFSRYLDSYPHQVNYLSRRHAHIFLKGDVPFVEDLGSTNGTFVAGKRLDEHAVALEEGGRLGFGGHHFVYQVSLQRSEAEAAPSDPTLTKLSMIMPKAAQHAGDADKTTFVAAADSFLDIFCVEQVQPHDDEVNEEASPAAETKKAPGKQTRKPGVLSKFLIFLSEFAGIFTGSERAEIKRAYRWGMAVVLLTGALILFLYWQGAPERELNSLLASGDFTQAAQLASQNLEHDSENADLRVLGTEAMLKANVPKWMALLKAHQFAQVAVVIADMKKLSMHNADARPFVTELEWMGNLEQFTSERGGADVEIKSPADAETIRRFLKYWGDDRQTHQRAFNTIASYVPEFRDAYAEALSHLRKLELTGSQNGNERQSS